MMQITHPCIYMFTSYYVYAGKTVHNAGKTLELYTPLTFVRLMQLVYYLLSLPCDAEHFVAVFSRIQKGTGFIVQSNLAMETATYAALLGFHHVKNQIYDVVYTFTSVIYFLVVSVLLCDIAYG